MPDAGADKIHELLDKDSVRLRKSAKRLAKALIECPERDRGVPPAIAFAALDDIRRFSRRLSDKVAKIDTSSGAKRDVIDALARLDRGYEAFELALHTGINETGSKHAKKARKLTERAAKDLRRADRKLT